MAFISTQKERGGGLALPASMDKLRKALSGRETIDDQDEEERGNIITQVSRIMVCDDCWISHCYMSLHKSLTLSFIMW